MSSLKLLLFSIFIFKTLHILGRRPFVQIMRVSSFILLLPGFVVTFTRLDVFITLAPAVLVLFFRVLVFPCCVMDVQVKLF
jgi:hypothetical protein